MLVDFDGRISLGERERRHGFIGRRERRDLIPLFGHEHNELNVMGVHHRVLDFAHLNLDGRPIDFDGRHVLLERAVDSARNELLHRLAAAHQGYAGIDDLDRDVSAVSALVQLDVHDSPFFLERILRRATAKAASTLPLCILGAWLEQTVANLVSRRSFKAPCLNRKQDAP